MRFLVEGALSPVVATMPVRGEGVDGGEDFL